MSSNVFQIARNAEAQAGADVRTAARIDHLGLRAKDLQAFEEIRSRLIERGAADSLGSR